MIYAHQSSKLCRYSVGARDHLCLSVCDIGSMASGQQQKNVIMSVVWWDYKDKQYHLIECFIGMVLCCWTFLLTDFSLIFFLKKNKSKNVDHKHCLCVMQSRAVKDFIVFRNPLFSLDFCNSSFSPKCSMGCASGNYWRRKYENSHNIHFGWHESEYMTSFSAEHKQTVSSYIGVNMAKLQKSHPSIIKVTQMTPVG